ncbi:MAG: SLBB domain-containing protein, partial [Candidatus Latescibacterota bacterium]
MSQPTDAAKSQVNPDLLTSVASAPLRRYGYEVFSLLPVEADSAIGAVDDGYPIGPGDEVVINVWGQAELSYRLPVERDGGITIPTVGRLQVGGTRLGNLQQRVTEFMARAYSSLNQESGGGGSFIDVSLGKLRMVQVFVVGEVRRPGAYLLSATSTVVRALYNSGGPTESGSLRDIRVQRHGEVVARLDFYRFIQQGEDLDNVRLQSGDVIVVPPALKLVALQGLVRRPAVYELREGEGLRRLLDIAGGLQPEAYTERVQVERIVENRQREVVDVNLKEVALAGGDATLADGDRVRVFSIPERFSNVVTVTGAVRRPGTYQLAPGMTVKGALELTRGVLDEAYTGRANLVRTRPDKTRQIIPFDLGKALAGDEHQDLALEPVDELVIFSIHDFRDAQFVTVDGLVRKPGRYELLAGMTLDDLIVLAGGLQDSAYVAEAEVARFDPRAMA